MYYFLYRLYFTAQPVANRATGVGKILFFLFFLWN
nr:MAG TPA: hypothetical protein [Caudoviricetes sp.]